MNDKSGHFLQLPESIMRHSTKLSGLQLAILADAWTWDNQGKEARRSNETLAEMFGATARAVTKSVKRLEELGLVELTYGANNIRFIKPRTTVHLNDRSPRTSFHPERPFTPTLNDRAPQHRTIVHGSPEQSFTQVYHRVEQIVEQSVEQKDAPKKEARPNCLAVVIDAFVEAGSTEDEANKYFDYYTANGWRVGRSPMKDWKAAARNWLRNASKFNSKNGKPQFTPEQQADNRAQLANYLRTGKV